jgi:hypothetical protein
VNTALLVIARARQTQLNRSSLDRQVSWQEIGRLKRVAIRRDHVDLALHIRASDKSIRAAAIAPDHHSDNLTALHSPFALDPQELVTKIEDEIVRFVI